MIRTPVTLTCLLASSALAAPPRLAGGGLFPHRTDIGNPAHPGTFQFDPASDCYTLGGGGTNMWFAQDDFHFAWTEASGDLHLTADIAWPIPGGNAHRKACLMIRSGLEPDAAYVDAALHGDGLTSLQYRETSGGPTREVQANINGPVTLRLERCGDFITFSFAKPGGPLVPAGASLRLALKDPVLVGLGVCAHDNEVLETATFSKVKLELREHRDSPQPQLQSTLEIIDIGSKDRRAVYTARDHFEAPNWTPDGNFLLFNRRGRICQIPVAGGEPAALDTGFAVKCNNDHGLSPDGTQLAISDETVSGKSIIYIVPAAGGAPRQVTPLAPSYWHGWSPDARTLVYCAERNGEYDVYAISSEGGAERRLTTAPGLDDGPEYSPDGRWIYFNSERTGRMQIWRMHPDGSNQEQVTRSDLNDWFPHPSPDGRWIVFLSYGPEVKGHPANLDVQLRIMPAGGGEPQVLARLFGGQGTINVPSWAPDSRKLAFVSYRLVHH